MATALTVEKLAEEARHAFLYARDAGKLVGLPDADSEEGWTRCAEAFMMLSGDQSLSELANKARTEYLIGARLPADSQLADLSQKPAWVAVALVLHGLLVHDPDEWPTVIEAARLNARERMRGVPA